MSSFTAAFAVSLIAGGAALALMVYFAKFRRDLLSIGIMASAAVRLLIMAGGTAFVLFSLKVDAVRFVIWVGIFYVLMLIWEIRFAIKLTNKQISNGGKA